MSVHTSTALPACPHPSSNWRAQARCRDHDPELFFPVGYSDATRRQEAAAVAVCHRCPSEDACLGWALANGVIDGVWGGKTEEQRKAMLRSSRRPTVAGVGGRG